MCTLGLRGVRDLVINNEYLLSQADLPKLREVLFYGNPIYESLEPAQARINVVKYIPQVIM